jgi:hypothetical protein
MSELDYLEPVIDEITPELLAEFSACAKFLLPLAQANVAQGQWPMEVAAWLIMVRDSFAQRESADLQ